MKKSLIILMSVAIVGTAVVLADAVKLDPEKIIGRKLEANEFLVDQSAKAFSHTNITVKVGQQVVFHNSDSVSHNVFSNSKINPFTIKIQKPGSISIVEFKEVGKSEVRCAIHPTMKLFVTVE